MIHIRRRIQSFKGRLYFTLPKGGKTRCVEPQRHVGAKPWQWQAAPRDGFHVLRHTFASIMLEAGKSVVTVTRWLGHSSPTVTLRYCAHFIPEAGRKGRTVIDGLLGRQGHRPAGRDSPDSPQG